MNDAHKKPSAAELRLFGLVNGGILVAIFGILIPLAIHWDDFSFSTSVLGITPTWPWVLAAIIALWALVHPASLIVLHRPWMTIGKIMNWIYTRIMMLTIFYFLIVPMGLLMRLFGKDSMRRKFDKSLDSYRVPSSQEDKNHMRTPY